MVLYILPDILAEIAPEDTANGTSALIGISTTEKCLIV